jgi:hypothetical protein
MASATTTIIEAVYPHRASIDHNGLLSPPA